MTEPIEPIESTKSTEPTEQPDGERLARYLAHAGIASRRHAEELIAAGRVQVNGMPVITQGTRIDPVRDTVHVDGKLVGAASRHVYVLLHKPVGYVSTASDPEGRPTVLDLLPPAIRRLRVYPVGRLDIDTSGLLLLTNDGDMALHLSHPRYAMDKRYQVLVEGYPSTAELVALRRGVIFTEDNGQRHQSAPAQVRVLERAGPHCWLELTIHEGRKRQIRRMLSAIGYRVLQLRRASIGPLTLEGIPEGKWRYLTGDEVGALR